MPSIKYDHTTINYSGSVTSKKYIVWHDTGVKGQTAAGNANYFRSVDRQSSAHYFVDKNAIVEVAGPNLVAWHCGDGAGKYGITNANSIGIELCPEADGSIHPQTIANAIWLGKKLMKDFGILPENNVRHYDASRKNCPQFLNTDGKWTKWYAFKAQLTGTIVSTPVSTPVSSTPSGGFAVGSKAAIRPAATHYQTGQTIAGWAKNKLYTILQVKAVNQSASKRAYLLSDIVSWVLEQDLIPVTAQTAKKPTRWINSGSTLHLPGTVSKWRVYRENGPYTVGNEVGYLNPAKFGGLTYAIKGDRLNDVVVIDTQDFGRVAIYVAKSTGATIKQKWIEVEA